MYNYTTLYKLCLRLRNCSGPVDWKTQVFMLDRGTCTGNDFCVSMTCDHQSWLWGRLCPWHLVGGEWAGHATVSSRAHSPPSQRATPRLSSSTEAENKFIPVFSACVFPPLEPDVPSYLSRHQAFSAFLVGDVLHGHKVQIQQKAHV